MKKITKSSLRRLLYGMVFVFWAANVNAQIEFEDVSTATGMTGYTESWGASWGDMNGDNWPDLFVQGHRSYPRFYRNNGEGAFDDVAYEKDPGNWIAKVFDDKHGASWVDFDNDGDQDLLISVSSTGDAQFLVNYNGTFTNRANDADLQTDDAARLGVWFDFNNDGHLDVAQIHIDGVLLRRRDHLDTNETPIDFDSVNPFISELFCDGSNLNYAQLLDVNGDGDLDFICGAEGVFPRGAYDYSTSPFTNITSSLATVSNVNDTITGDFNNDLLNDMVLTRGAIRPSGATLVGDRHIEAWLRKDGGVAVGKGFYFEAEGKLTVTFDHKGMGQYEASKVYELDSKGTTLADAGPLRLRYLANERRWRVQLDTTSETQAYVRIDAENPITNLAEHLLDTPEFATETMVLLNGQSGLQPVYNTGLHTPMFCVSAAAADFDNDMDIDIYLVCRRGAENLPNRLYENQGDGTFIEVTNFGGEGPVGAGLEFGVGDSVVVADYDVDGFVDLFVTNGQLYYPVGPGGPDTLLRNKGNDNHWLEIDLQGIASNRDGIGAKVYVTAGGVTQLREANGGYQRWSQNDRRLHFGLADNLTADVRIEWPSGAVDEFINVGADGLYDAMEGISITPALMGPPVQTQLQSADVCGEPPYDYDYGPVLMLYKDCETNIWSFRAKGGRFKQYQLLSEGTLAADAPFTQITPVNLTSSDTVTNGITPNELVFSMGAWHVNDRGFDFSTAGQSQSCFDLTAQDIPTLIVGGARKKITGSFDLVTLGACTALPPPPAECGNPEVNNAIEHGLYAWRDCNFISSTVARWNFTLSGGGQPWGSYTGLVESDKTISAVGIDLEQNDVLDTVPGDQQIDFTLYLGGNGVDGFQVDVPMNSVTCLNTDSLPAGTSVNFGEGRQPVGPNVNLLTLEDCDVGCH
jgi:hypothetical protein